MSCLSDVEGLPILSVLVDTVLSRVEMTTTVVAAAVVERDGRILVTRRIKGTHLEGYWEFPGGKCESGETLHACLNRELQEELAVDAIVGDTLLSTTHAYPERTVVI